MPLTCLILTAKSVETISFINCCLKVAAQQRTSKQYFRDGFLPLFNVGMNFNFVDFINV